MRKFLVILLVVAANIGRAQAVESDFATKPAKKTQSVKPFKVSLAGGYALPIDNLGDNASVKAGFAYSIEPQYELGRNLEVGFRFEQAFIQRSETLDKDIFFTSKAKSILSGVVTANYVIRTGMGFSPFVGFGAGAYYADPSQQTFQQLGSPAVSYPLPTTLAFGGLGRVGVKYGVLHVEAIYNLVSDASVTNAANKLTLTAKNSYFSVNAGITIGGSH